MPKSISLFSAKAYSQNEIPDILIAGIEDTETYLTHYTRSTSESMIYHLSNNWYHTAKVKKGSFHISILASGIRINESDKFFHFNPDEYNYLTLVNSDTDRLPTLLGSEIDEQFEVQYTEPDGSISYLQTYVPEGVLNESLNYVPLIFPQLSFTLFKGTEIKGMFLPTLKYEGFGLSSLGIAAQHELTTWVKNSDNFPLALSLLVGYRNLSLFYKFDNDDLEYIDDASVSMQLKQETNVMTYALIASTNFKVINLYAGLNVVSGDSGLKLSGKYLPNEGYEQDNLLETPIDTSIKLSGIKYNIGASLRLGFIMVHGEYSKFNEHSAYSVGLNFGK